MLRPATGPDLPALHELINSAYRGESSRVGWTTEADLLGGQRVDPDGLADLLRDPGSVVLVYDGVESLDACVLLQNRSPTAYLGMLTVRPARQAAGLGRRVLAAAERWATHHWRTARIEMTVIRQREELIAWYQRRGYELTGERRPFPYGNARFGLPKRPDLEFVVLTKRLVNDVAD